MMNNSFYKKFSIILSIIILFSLIFSLVFFQKKNELTKIAIANYGPHISLTDTIRGIKDGLRNHCIKENIDASFEIVDVNFEQSMIVQMLTKLKVACPSVFVTLSTPVSQAAKNIIIDIPIVFVNVTDPDSANLTHVAEDDSSNITGVADRQNITAFLDFAKKILPNAKKIGFLYSIADANDGVLLHMMQEAVKIYDMELVAIPIESQRNISIKMQSFMNNPVDLIYVGTSGLMQPSLPAIVANADKLKIPVFNSEDNAVRKNLAFASFGISYYKMGLIASNMIAEILNGANPASIPIEYPTIEDHKAFISKQKANQLGISLPTELENCIIIE